MIRVAAAFGMQDFETFALLEDGGMAFSVWLPDEEAMELKFRLYLKEHRLFEQWIDVYKNNSCIDGLHTWAHDSTAALDDLYDDFFQTSYGRHICSGFYLLGIDTDFIDFLGLFTAHEKLEMALQHKALMQKLSQLALTPNLGT